MVLFKVFSTCKTIFKVDMKSIDITLISLLQYLDTFSSTRSSLGRGLFAIKLQAGGLQLH